MNITDDTSIYCLIGNPISKTLSPIIHNNYYKMIDKNNIYLTFNIIKTDLEIIVNSFKTLNIKGFNVTLPHKIKIMEFLDEISEEAKRIGAVNTVKNKNGKLIGYNTDGIGFLKSLELEKISLKNKIILILGAGGAANAIANSVSTAEVRKIYINNRSLYKAKCLSEKLKQQFPKVLIEYGSLNLENLIKKEIDIIVNCTSVGMYPNIDKSPINFDGFSEGLIVYDLIYKPKITKFIQLAKTNNHHTIGGISMLINQALSSQEIWLDEEDKNFMDNFNRIKRILEVYVE